MCIYIYIYGDRERLIDILTRGERLSLAPAPLVFQGAAENQTAQSARSLSRPRRGCAPAAPTKTKEQQKLRLR